MSERVAAEQGQSMTSGLVYIAHEALAAGIARELLSYKTIGQEGRGSRDRAVKVVYAVLDRRISRTPSQDRVDLDAELARLGIVRETAINP